MLMNKTREQKMEKKNADEILRNFGSITILRKGVVIFNLWPQSVRSFDAVA